MYKQPIQLRNEEGGEGSSGGTAVESPPAHNAPAAPPAAPAPEAAVAKADNAAPKVETAKPEAAKPDATSEAEKAGYWPANWRETVSKDDAKILSRLGRYASPEVALKALIDAQNRIAAGELKPALKKNASPEELKAWREDHGIPETPDKYNLGPDVKVEGIDPEMLSEVLKAAHASNQTPEQVQSTIKAWNQIQNKIAETRVERDFQAQKTGEDILREEWGGEFRRNINLIHGMLDGTTTPAMKEAVLGGRLADGTPIGSSPEALKFLVNLALIQNPAGTVVPGSAANPMKGVEDEISSIEKTMREKRAAYNKDEKMQSRYRELLDAREKLKTRG